MIGYVTPSYLYYYQELMATMRDAIQAGRLGAFIAAFAAQQTEGDLEPI